MDGVSPSSVCETLKSEKGKEKGVRERKIGWSLFSDFVV